LPELFGDELDRMTLWTRIGTGLESAVIKSENDLELFINHVLRYIKAAPQKVASHGFILEFLNENENKNSDWKKQFFEYIANRGFVVIAKSRQVWEDKKNAKK